MKVAKEILLKDASELEQYERAKGLAARDGVPVGALLMAALDGLERHKKADGRRVALMQQERNDLRAKRRGM